MLLKGLLVAKIIGVSLGHYFGHFTRAYAQRNTTQVAGALKGEEKATKTVAIIGASFSGLPAARYLTSNLPLDGSWKLVIIEPNSHFHFTWTLPRFCVIEGHEEKTFIPYEPMSILPSASKPFVRWIRARVETIGEKDVRIEGTGERIPYDYLVIATGAGVGLNLPSRVGATSKKKGVELMKQIQTRIKEANKLVVVGGGAAGVELATDAKHHYPEKNVTLVHSRDAVMHRFGPELQEAALKGLQDLGVNVLLGERTVKEDPENGVMTLRSGKTLEFDYSVNCVGQKPSSALLREIAPEAISESGRIRVKSTLQVDSPKLPNVYACGDVAETGIQNPNGRTAMAQAEVVADNIARAVKGNEPTAQYSPHWIDAMIKLTLGLDKSITHFSDGTTEVLFNSKEKDKTLMIRRVWELSGNKPYEDPGSEEIPVRNPTTPSSVAS